MFLSKELFKKQLYFIFRILKKWYNIYGMYYPLMKEKPEAEQKQPSLAYLIVAFVLLVVAGVLWSWPLFGLPAEILALIFAIFHLKGEFRRPAIVAIVVAAVLLVLTLINISVRIYLLYT